MNHSVIQASDVAHCMQHWDIYQKYNRRLFEEQYEAYVNGHTSDNPGPGWYKGEIWFFENYISKFSLALFLTWLSKKWFIPACNWMLSNAFSWLLFLLIQFPWHKSFATLDVLEHLDTSTWSVQMKIYTSGSWGVKKSQPIRLPTSRISLAIVRIVRRIIEGGGELDLWMISLLLSQRRKPKRRQGTCWNTSTPTPIVLGQFRYRKASVICPLKRIPTKMTTGCKSHGLISVEEYGTGAESGDSLPFLINTYAHNIIAYITDIVV